MPSSVSQSTFLTAPRETTRRSQRLVWLAATAFVLILIGLIVGAPLAMSRGFVFVGVAIYKGFSPFCHQLTERSFHLDGHSFAVCSRCTGIYAGFAAGVVVYPLIRSLKRTDSPARVWLVIAAVPIGVDWFLGFAGIWANTHLSRFLTGAFLGVVCAFFVLPGLLDMLEIDWRRFFSRTSDSKVQDNSTAFQVPHEPAAPSDYGSPASRI
jgi:uncharacterized membrane protein